MPRSVVRDERGFTLIEIMVAAMVLLVGILGVATIVNTANGSVTTSKAREQGLALSRDLIESARSLRYQSLRPDTVVASLQAMPGLGNAGAGPGWTIQRRGITYSVAVGVCSVDDPGDTTGAHPAGSFCVRSSVQATAATCKSLIGQPASIGGTAGATGPDAGDCGLDTNHDGQVDNLVQGPANDCPTGTSVAAGTCDEQPDDFKRLVLLVTWDRGGGSRYVLQQATVPFPGLSAYSPVSDLVLNGYTGANGVYAVNDNPSALSFTATSSQPANQVDWLKGGVDQGPIPGWSGTTGTFSWALGNAPANETVPAGNEVVDGTYTIGARVQDAAGVHGIEKDITVKLNRRIPFAPSNFVIAGTTNASGTVTSVKASWVAPPDRDVTGFKVYRQSSAGTDWICDQATVTTCTDSSPPSGSVTYWVVAEDVDSSGAPRDGVTSVPATITVGNTPPTTPTITSGTYDNSSKQVTLVWSASTDTPGDSIAGYDVQRSGCTAATIIGTALGTATTIKDTSAPTKVWCTYNVRALDSHGAYSGWSSSYQVKTQ